MNKISVNKEYIIDPLNPKNRAVLLKNNPNNFSVTGDLILVFGTGYTCVDARVILSPLFRELYEL